MFDSHPQTLTNNFQSPIFKILLIVRPSKLVNLLKLELSHKGYELEVVHDVMSGLLRCSQLEPQLIILDWHISIFSAAELCCRLRSNFSPISIFVLDSGQKTDNRLHEKSSQELSSKIKPHRNLKDLASAKHRVAALDAGADDCISFPFVMDEFLARIRVQLRKYTVKSPSALVFEDLRLDTATREVYRRDRYIYLTTREFALLEYLVAHPRQVLTRTQILDRVWGYDYAGDSNIIEVYIRYLRLKLEQNNARRLIYTVRGVGYVVRKSSFNLK